MVNSITDLQKYFPIESILKFHSSGDVTLITPWMKLAADMGLKFLDGSHGTFEEGYLVIPLMEIPESNDVMIFVLSNGFDFNDEIPEWLKDNTLGNLFLKCDPTIMRRTPGIGTVTISVKDQDEQPLNCADFLKVRSEYLQILGFFRAYDQPNFNSVRFSKPIQKNANNALYEVIHQPCFKGNIARISSNGLNVHHSVTVNFDKVDENKFGTLNIQFKNACFNFLGFLTHEVAV
eukprot:TCONS_00003366-protein